MWWQEKLIVSLLVLGVMSSEWGPVGYEGCAVAQAAKQPQPPRVADVAPELELKNLQGDVVSLKKLYEKTPVVILVLRGWPGYQCPLCTRQVSEFLSKKKEFANVQLVLVYPGPAEQLTEHAQEFQAQIELPGNYHYVLDPDFKFTNTWGLRWEAPGETAYPSTFIVNTDGKIAFGQTSTTHGDRVTAQTVLEKLRELAQP